MTQTDYTAEVRRHIIETNKACEAEGFELPGTPRGICIPPTYKGDDLPVGMYELQSNGRWIRTGGIK